MNSKTDRGKTGSTPTGGQELSRRKLLRLAAYWGSAAAVLGIAGCGSGKVDTQSAEAAASSGPVARPASTPATGKLEKTELTLGFIPLTDCAPLVIASEKGFYKKYGLDVRIKKMASWGATRDAIHKGEIDGAHILLGMVVGSTLGVGDVNSPAPKVPMCVLAMLNLNGQGITLSKALLESGAQAPASLKKLIDEKAAKLTFAMTFPPGTHAMWMRYWLASGRIHPDRDVKLITIPPPQMVANMKTGNMDGFCVGEPWNARAVDEEIGFTAITTQGIWKNHPEKCLGVTASFANANPNTCTALLAGTLEASKWLDDLKNRDEAANIIGKSEYVNCKPETILGRLLGKYTLAPGGAATEDPDYMRFFEREASVPFLSHAVWFMTQHRRWGMLKDQPDYWSEAREIMRADLYAKGCVQAGLPKPAQFESRGIETLFDGIAFDPKDPEGYIQKFDVKSLA